MQESRSNSYLFGGNAPYVEEMYEAYLDNPGSVPDNWRKYFDALQHVPAVDGTEAKDVPHQPVINAFAELAKQGGSRVAVATGADSEMGRKRTAVQQLIAAYRNVGARWADLQARADDLTQELYTLRESAHGEEDRDRAADTLASLRALRSAMAEEQAAGRAGGAGSPEAAQVRSRLLAFEASIRALRAADEQLPRI